MLRPPVLRSPWAVERLHRKKTQSASVHGPARTRGNRHTSVSALIGRPFQSPVRIVVTLWRCPGLVGLYVFNPDSAPAAKPRQSGGGPLSKAGGLDRPDRSVRSAAACEDGSICCQDATVAVDSWRTQELHTESRAATDTPCPRQLLDHSSRELREAAAARCAIRHTITRDNDWAKETTVCHVLSLNVTTVTAHAPVQCRPIAQPRDAGCETLPVVAIVEKQAARISVD